MIKLLLLRLTRVFRGRIFSAYQTFALKSRNRVPNNTIINH